MAAESGPQHLGVVVVGAVSDACGLKAALTVIPVFCALAGYFLWYASRHYDNDMRQVAAGLPAGKEPAP